MPTDRSQDPPAVKMRMHRPGDIGWAIQRHGVLYDQEYGWDTRFEGLVAQVLGQFAERGNSAEERSWIAEVDGERVGCVFLMRDSQTVARLRCLLVEPSVRGMGVGTKLVQACTDFARQAGYEKLILWTNDVLHAARRIYERAGFQLVEENTHHSFGVDLVGQTWALSLV
jgi:N-acetylglutamate synthase-like GNAT family acetyltransferase